MRKIPTLFERDFSTPERTITPKVTSGCEIVLKGACIPTLKWDGAACAIIRGELYKRYDAKQKYGKSPPEGAIPCQPEPDPVTGHFPHWVKCKREDPADIHFWEAFHNSFPFREEGMLTQGVLDGTYEAVGPAWQGNPYGMFANVMQRHGGVVIHELMPCSDLDESPQTLPDDVLTFDGIRQYLAEHEMEGIVWWLGNKPFCKVKRRDFGLEWPIRKTTQESNP